MTKRKWWSQTRLDLQAKINKLARSRWPYQVRIGSALVQRREPPELKP